VPRESKLDLKRLERLLVARQSGGQPEHQPADAEVGEVQMHVVPVAQHPLHVAAEIAEVVFVRKLPPRDVRPGRLPLHQRKLLIAERPVKRPKVDELTFAHGVLRVRRVVAGQS